MWQFLGTSFSRHDTRLWWCLCDLLLEQLQQWIDRYWPIHDTTCVGQSTPGVRRTTTNQKIDMAWTWRRDGLLLQDADANTLAVHPAENIDI